MDYELNIRNQQLHVTFQGQDYVIPGVVAHQQGENYVLSSATRTQGGWTGEITCTMQELQKFLPVLLWTTQEGFATTPTGTGTPTGTYGGGTSP